MHTEFTQLMSLALDHEATPDELRRLRAHVQTCQACAATWLQWQTLDQRMSAAPFVVPASSLVASVSQRIAERELRRRRTWWVGSGLFLSWGLAFALGLAGLFGVAGWVSGHPQQIAAVLSGLANFLSGATWLLQALVRLMQEYGAPRLAAGVGLFATVTCGLAVMWVWVMGRSQSRLRSPMFVGQ